MILEENLFQKQTFVLSTELFSEVNDELNKLVEQIWGYVGNQEFNCKKVYYFVFHKSALQQNIAGMIQPFNSF